MSTMTLRVEGTRQRQSARQVPPLTRFFFPSAALTPFGSISTTRPYPLSSFLLISHALLVAELMLPSLRISAAGPKWAKKLSSPALSLPSRIRRVC